MKPLVIYHADCTDGYGAAFAAWLKLGDEAEYVPMQYGEVKTVADMNSVLAKAGIPNGEGVVYVLDFSLPRDVMEWLMTEVKRVVWLDHHKTAFEMWCGGIPEDGVFTATGTCASGQGLTVLDNNKSGALLAWEYFHPDTEVPMLIKHIDDRDRWQWKLEGSAEIHAALGSYQPWSFADWKARFIADGSTPFDSTYVNNVMYPRLIEEGSAILRAQKQHVERMAKQARKCWIKTSKPIDLHGSFLDGVTPGWQGLAVNAPIHQSEVGHELANASGTFGLVWYLAADQRVRCSLRSNGEYDASAIARAFGGGGHRNAAGFETDIETLMGWLK